MIHLLRERATEEHVRGMFEAYEDYIKLAVDVRRGTLAGGGIVHADCEAVLLEDGSKQEDVWGADWIPSTRELRYEALINIRPDQDNPSMTVMDPSIQNRIDQVIRRLLGDV